MVFGKKSYQSSTRGGTGAAPRTSTYHTRVSEYAGADRAAGDAALSPYGEFYGHVQRKLFAEVAAGRSATALKSEYLERYGIPARMYNAVRVSLEGKVASVKEQQKLRLDSLCRRDCSRGAADRRCRRAWSLGSGSPEAPPPCSSTVQAGGTGRRR